jgi:hypothetical protein
VILKNLDENISPEIPLGSSVELTISYDEQQFISGKDGIVWATYDKRQVEVIQNAMLALNITSEVKKIELAGKDLFIIKIINQTDLSNAMDFIWRSSTGLRLKPDWIYPEGETNKSFEQWLGGQ